MLIKKIFSDSLIYSVGPQIPKIASLFVLPIITRYLTSTDYGIAGVILAYTSFLSAMSDLGFSVLMMNSFYNYKLKWKHYWRQYHYYLSLWAIFYSFILGTVLFFIMPEEAVKMKYFIIGLFVIPSLVFNVTTIIATRYYQYSSKPVFISTVSAVIGVISIILNLYTIAYLKMGYLGWFVSNFIASFLTFLCYVYPVYFKYKITPLIKFRKTFLLKSLRISLPVIPHNYSSFLLNTSDRVVMDRLNVNISKIGEYNLAYTFGSYMEFFGNAVGIAVGPIYTSLFSSKSKEAAITVKFITNFLQVVFILVSLLISLWCKELFELLIKNKELKSVYPIAIIIIMGYAYRPYYWTAITRLQYSENTNQLWKITFLSGVLNVVLNLFFIPIYGISAAAITTFLCLMYIGFAGYFLPVFRKVEPEKYSPIFFIVLILISTLMVYALKDINILLKLLISLALLFSFIGYSYINKFKLFNLKLQ